MDTQTISQESINQKWGFFGTLIWSVVILVVHLISTTIPYIFALIIYFAMSTEHLKKAKHDILPFSSFLSLITCGLALWGIIKLKKNSNLKQYLAINKASLCQIICWGLVALAFLLSNNLKTYFQGTPLTDQTMNPFNSSSYPWLLFFALVVAAPIREELLHRGFMFSGFSSSFVDPVGAIILTSLSWMALHFPHDLYNILLLFFGGLALAMARFKTNSILPGIIMHSLINMETAVKYVFFVR